MASGSLSGILGQAFRRAVGGHRLCPRFLVAIRVCPGCADGCRGRCPGRSGRCRGRPRIAGDRRWCPIDLGSGSQNTDPGREHGSGSWARGLDSENGSGLRFLISF